MNFIKSSDLLKHFIFLQYIPLNVESPDTIWQFVICKTSERFNSLHT